jgi:hypothetical protein
LTNEFGVKLDANGYAPSVVEPFDTGMCHRCGRMGDLVRHEVFHGIKNRKTSKALGAWVYLCPDCHNELHNLNPKLDWDLKRTSQLKVMAAYDWSIEDFRERFGRSYV